MDTFTTHEEVLELWVELSELEAREAIKRNVRDGLTPEEALNKIATREWYQRSVDEFNYKFNLTGGLKLEVNEYGCVDYGDDDEEERESSILRRFLEREEVERVLEELGKEVKEEGLR